MLSIRTLKTAWDTIQSGSGKNKIFSPNKHGNILPSWSSGFMWLIGIIASTLFAAGINGGPTLMVAPLWVVYIFVNSISHFGSWASYFKIVSNLGANYLIEIVIQI